MKLRDILFENPDAVFNYGKIVAKWSDTPNYAFGYYHNKLFIGNNGVVHYKMLTLPDIEKYGDTFSDIDRRTFEFPGRIWPEKKIISFWKFPTEIELKKIIKELNAKIKEKGLNFAINKNWEIDITTSGNTKLISIGDYINEKLSPYTNFGIKEWPGWEGSY